MVPLKYVSNFSTTPKMPQTNCEINLIVNWSANCPTLSMLLQIK